MRSAFDAAVRILNEAQAIEPPAAAVGSRGQADPSSGSHADQKDFPNATTAGGVTAAACVPMVFMVSDGSHDLDVLTTKLETGEKITVHTFTVGSSSCVKVIFSFFGKSF
jgi:hypothetical protein